MVDGSDIDVQSRICKATYCFLQAFKSMEQCIISQCPKIRKFIQCIQPFISTIMAMKHK